MYSQPMLSYKLIEKPDLSISIDSDWTTGPQYYQSHAKFGEKSVIKEGLRVIQHRQLKKRDTNTCKS